MLSTQHVADVFSQSGGMFVTQPEKIAEKLRRIKAFVFDWDGVFNNAAKNEQKSSTFNEVDSMGTNLLRFSHYLINGQMPRTGVISGEKNNMAIFFCQREHFDTSYFKVKNKIKALEHFCNLFAIQAQQVCYVFDDVLDLSIAEACGLRMLVNRKANPLFVQYCVQNNLTDYITYSQSGNFAVREIAELLMGFYGNYNDVLTFRKTFSEKYRNYFHQRQQTATRLFTLVNDEITEATDV